MVEDSIERKGVSRTIAIALIVVCIVLLATLLGVIVNYTSIIGEKDGAIANKDSQLNSMNDTILNLNSQLRNMTNQAYNLTIQLNNLTAQVDNLTVQMNNLTNKINNLTNPPFTSIIAMTKTTTADNIVWTITAIGGSSQILKGDVYVQVKYASNSTFTIQTVQLLVASGTHGFVYSSATPWNYIAVGDTFMLSKTAGYSSGDTLTLVHTASATDQYCIVTY